MDLKKIDWNEPEDADEMRRPFTVKVEESVAKAFIQAVRSNGLFVRETIVKLMRGFSTQFGGTDGNGQGSSEAVGTVSKRDRKQG